MLSTRWMNDDEPVDENGSVEISSIGAVLRSNAELDEKFPWSLWGVTLPLTFAESLPDIPESASAMGICIGEDSGRLRRTWQRRSLDRIHIFIPRTQERSFFPRQISGCSYQLHKKIYLEGSRGFPGFNAGRRKYKMSQMFPGSLQDVAMCCKFWYFYSFCLAANMSPCWLSITGSGDGYGNSGEPNAAQENDEPHQSRIIYWSHGRVWESHRGLSQYCIDYVSPFPIQMSYIEPCILFSPSRCLANYCIFQVLCMGPDEILPLGEKPHL